MWEEVLETYFQVATTPEFAQRTRMFTELVFGTLSNKTLFVAEGLSGRLTTLFQAPRFYSV
jgi:hypothetical protein